VPSLQVVGCVAACLSGVAQPVGGRVCYILVSELLVETPGWYGMGLLVRVSWLRSNSDCEVENLRRNGVAESTQELECHRSFVRVRRIVTILFEFGSNRHCGIKRDLRSLDRGQVNKGHLMKVKQRLSHNRQIAWREIDDQEALRGTKLHES
jgi:hypothetical protein